MANPANPEKPDEEVLVLAEESFDAAALAPVPKAANPELVTELSFFASAPLAAPSPEVFRKSKRPPPGLAAPSFEAPAPNTGAAVPPLLGAAAPKPPKPENMLAPPCKEKNVLNLVPDCGLTERLSD